MAGRTFRLFAMSAAAVTTALLIGAGAMSPVAQADPDERGAPGHGVCAPAPRGEPKPPAVPCMPDYPVCIPFDLPWPVGIPTCAPTGKPPMYPPVNPPDVVIPTDAIVIPPLPTCVPGGHKPVPGLPSCVHTDPPPTTPSTTTPSTTPSTTGSTTTGRITTTTTTVPPGTRVGSGGGGSSATADIGLSELAITGVNLRPYLLLGLAALTLGALLLLVTRRTTRRT